MVLRHRMKMSHLRYVLSLMMIVAAAVGHARYIRSNGTELCDIFVAGGSTAALAAALSAAKYDPQKVVCLTEPTDWLGGQLTSSAVSALDLGRCQQYYPEYLPWDFRDFMDSLAAYETDVNPGRCWVSVKCYTPRDLLENWIEDALVKAGPNLKVFLNTVVKAVASSGVIVTGVTAIQRTSHAGINEWRYLLSEKLDDWYSPVDSTLFSKTEVTFTGRHGDGSLVVIEATELGDVLVTSGARYRQGIETPTEDSDLTLDTCGQAITDCFYMVYNFQEQSPHDWIPGEDSPWDEDYSLLGYPWGQVWSYRRAQGVMQGSSDEPKAGEVSLQNWGTEGGNDYLDGYVFIGKEATDGQREDWRGGVNMTTVAQAELRAYGWYHWYRNEAPANGSEFLSLGTEPFSGTGTGLAKFPYIRDTRRSIGLDGFTLKKSDLDEESDWFHDRIALGNYLFADSHPLKSCEPPAYLEDKYLVPYYIPFRALTSDDFQNLLVAGKTMAQTFHANMATRLHPEEWATGTAAGVAAAIMQQGGPGGGAGVRSEGSRRTPLSSRQMYEQVETLQAALREGFMPLEWGSYQLGGPDGWELCDMTGGQSPAPEPCPSVARRAATGHRAWTTTVVAVLGLSLACLSLCRLI